MVLLSGALAVLGVLTLRAVNAYQMAQLESDLAGKARQINLSLNQALLMSPASETHEAALTRLAPELIRQVTQERALSTILYTLEGKATNGVDRLEPTLLELIRDGQVLYRIQDQKGDPQLTYVDYLAPLYRQEEIMGVLRLRYYYSPYLAFYNSMARMILITGVSVFLFSLVAALWYFGRMTSAIVTLKMAVKRVESGDYSQTSVLSRADELGALSQGVVQMARTIETALNRLHEEQAQLTKAVAKLKALEATQRTFFGSITHEFKTPLSVINAYNDLIEMYPEDEALQTEVRNKIRAEVQKLNRMVENALEFARHERYEFDLQMSSFDFKALIEEIVERLSIKADKFNLKWHLSLEPGILNADREMMGQVLVNLLDNAIKYNVTRGEIWVSLTFGQKVKLVIENTGEGLSDIVKERLFEPYAVDDELGQTEEAGTGLGLALVKRLVALQRGTIVILEGLPEHQRDHLKGCRVVIEF